MRGKINKAKDTNVGDQEVDKALSAYLFTKKEPSKYQYKCRRSIYKDRGIGNWGVNNAPVPGYQVHAEGYACDQRQYKIFLALEFKGLPAIDIKI